MDRARVRMEVSEGVALVTIDNPPVNSLNAPTLRELFERFKEAYTRADVQGIVLTGAREKFSGGADIKAMSRGSSMNTEAFALEVFNNVIEGAPKPIVAAIFGFALGGGLELAMACHARVAASKARLGLPELQLGIIPGLGGTQRLPRLAGVEKAVNMMLAAKVIAAEEALEAGILDAVCHADEVLILSRKYALDIARNKYPFSRTLQRTDKVEPRSKALEVIAAARMKAKKMHKHVEYPFICLDAIEYGILHGGLEGTVLERKLGLQTVNSPPAKALMHLFLAERTAYKVPGVTDGSLKPRSIKLAGVIGGGLMGSGIATALILNNVNVRFKEIDEHRLNAGICRVEANLRNRIARGAMSEDQFQSAMNRLTGTVDYEGFDSVDLVIEAVIENLSLKRQIFKEIDKVCSRDCIFASNTSSINLDNIAEGVSSPDRIIGAHFFSPAHVMRLLEIVRTTKTSKQTICDLLSLSRTMKKVPVVVRNVIGFAVNRVFHPYHKMASFLVDLGLHPYRIDSVIKDFGMPMGPFRLGDMAGLQIGKSVSQMFESEFEDRIYKSQLGRLLVDANRVGEAVGKGFYNYHGSRQEIPAPELDEFLEKSRNQAGLQTLSSALTDQDIVEMIFFPVVNEACRVVDQNIVLRSSDLDIASILGMGFPSFRGGIFFWGETVVGLDYILSKLQDWQNEYGPYFRPTPSLHKFVACQPKMKASKL